MAIVCVSILRVLVLSLLHSFQHANGITLGLWERRFRGEDADVYFGVEKMNNNPIINMGYAGNGYADFGGSGSFVQWNVETLFNLTNFEISMRYRSLNQGSCSLYIDNIKQGEYSIDPTGPWNRWEDSIPITVSLEEGIHQIKIVTVGTSGPKVDFLRIRAIREFTVLDDDLEEEEVMLSYDYDTIIAEEVQEIGGEEENEEGRASEKSNFLRKDMGLSRGEFITSPNGSYEMGLVGSTGELVIKNGSTDRITWSNGVLGGELVSMQTDGNLVVQNSDFKPIWNTGSSGQDGAQLEIDDNGIASIVLDSVEIWTTRESFSISYNNVAESKSGVSGNGNDNGNSQQVLAGNNPDYKRFAEKVVLNSLEKLSPGDFVSSPSDRYLIGLNDVGNLILQDMSDLTIIWNANVKGCAAATMQSDGNFVLRDVNNTLIWTTHTSTNPGARLVIDDGGRLSLMVSRTPIWMEGVPRGVYYDRPSSPSLSFPLRGIFYYPWYPETWSVNGNSVKFVPDLGKYSSDDATIVEEHIDAMEYAYSDLAIASWWGPGTSQELSRISLLMDKTSETKSSIKWTIYYENEMFRNPSVEKIRSDLDYLKKWFVWHPSWAFIDEKPIIFVYNDAGCDVNERWMEAAGDDWYVVMKVFPGWSECASTPNSYHQYGPSTPYIHIKGVSSSVSPGFWRADQDTAKLPRLSNETFCENTKKMVDSGENWQLVTTFNEAGEGTLVEASSENWGSDTKYGFYLDCLHELH